MREVSRSTRLARSAEQVWEEARTLGGVNHELAPFLRMTVPRGIPADTTLEELPVGETVGRSWILLFGFLPTDYDDLRIMEMEPPRRFLERSRTLNFSTWEHERTVEPDAGAGSVITDRLRFELRPVLRRVPGFGGLAKRVVEAIFTHRHRRLRRRDTAAHD
ncbi:MAG TPA: hypothetical protein VKA36_04465 [Solirubrobacterales bacterium]|nr:hypothetical protein [Solirubrobacterales bacterium]